MAKSIALLPPSGQGSAIQWLKRLWDGGAHWQHINPQQTDKIHTKTHALFISIFRSKDKNEEKRSKSIEKASKNNNEKQLTRSVTSCCRNKKCSISRSNESLTELTSLRFGSYARIDTWDGLAWRLNGLQDTDDKEQRADQRQKERKTERERHRFPLPNTIFVS